MAVLILGATWILIPIQAYVIRSDKPGLPGSFIDRTIYAIRGVVAVLDTRGPLFDAGVCTAVSRLYILTKSGHRGQFTAELQILRLSLLLTWSNSSLIQNCIVCMG